jgi:hypothetical protein
MKLLLGIPLPNYGIESIYTVKETKKGCKQYQFI